MMSLTLYPPPKMLKISRKRLKHSHRHHLKLCNSYSDYLTDAINRFQSSSDLKTIITFAQVPAETTLLTLKLSRSKLAAEAYQITTSDSGFLLTAGTETGLFRGLATMEQILAQLDSNGWPFIELSDEPDFTHRGVMLDVSRCKVPTLSTLKKLIDSFASLKYNQLQLYTEHTFAFTAHPRVWANASPYDAADMLEIQSYCSARFIDLVPNLNCFGHFERWLRYPEYHKYAECPDGFVHPFNNQKIEIGSTLKPNKQSLKLIDDLHAEYLPIFDSDYFNVGGDEPWELGQGYSRLLCEEQGATNVYIDFMTGIKNLVDKRKRKMMFWSDIVLKQPESLKRLSTDLIAMNWGYEGNHPFKKECEQVAAQNIPFYVCPGTSSWNSLTGRIDNTVRNLASAAKNGLRFGAIGYLVTDWGDHGHHQYLPLSYPGFALGACQSWNHKASRSIDLPELVNQIFFKEPEPISARIIERLGKVLELAPSKIRNATIFNRLLFWDMKQEPEVTKSIPDSQLDACEAELAAIRNELHLVVKNHHIAGQDATLVAQELENAIGMAVHGIHRLQYFRGAPLSLAYLRENLAKIIAQHEHLWLSRNRSGGLAESTNHLNESLTALV